MTRLSGRVPETGTAIQGATVAIIDTQGVEDPSQWSVVAQDTTDANGEWSVSGLASATTERYHAVAQYDDGAEFVNFESLPYLSTPADVFAPETQLTINTPTPTVEVASAIPDSGLVHRYSAKDQSDASSLVDQTGTTDMSAVGSPQYLSSGINGNPAFQTDGSDDAFSSSLWSISNDSWTIAFVGSFDALNGFRYIWAQGDVSAGGVGFSNDNDGLWVVVQDNTNYNGGIEDTNLHTFIVTYGSGTLVVGVDDTTVINTSATDPSPTGDSSIGGDVNQSRFQALTFGEFLIYDSFKDATSRSDIRTYFGDEWGV